MQKIKKFKSQKLCSPLITIKDGIVSWDGDLNFIERSITLEKNDLYTSKGYSHASKSFKEIHEFSM